MYHQKHGHRIGGRIARKLALFLGTTGLLWTISVQAQDYPDMSSRIYNLTAEASYSASSRRELQKLHGRRILLSGWAHVAYVDPPPEFEDGTRFFLTPNGFPDYDAFMQGNPHQRIYVECREGAIPTDGGWTTIAVIGRFLVKRTNYGNVESHYMVDCLRIVEAPDYR